MQRFLRTLFLLGAWLLIPTAAWDASVSQSLSIAVTAATSLPGPSNLYAQWSNFPQNLNFFPIAVWLANPTRPLGSGAPYATVALSAAAAKMNIFLGIDNGGTAWPTGVCSGDSNGYLAAIKAVGMLSIPDIDISNNTSSRSISSVICLAANLEATANLIGFNMGDEPDCTGWPMSSIPGQVATLEGYDSTRPKFLNLTNWVFSHGICNPISLNINAVKAISVNSFDAYPLINPWQGFPGVPQDAMWIQGWSVHQFIAYGRSGEPMWAYVESGTNALGFSSQNGSTCNANTNLCTPHNNEYRATNEQVNAEAWMSLINGANGIEWFCHDSVALAFCLGEQTGGSGSLANSIQANLTYIDTTILSFAQQLNATTAGICTMINGAGFANFTTSCSNGILTVVAGNVSMPASAMVKSYNGVHYLFAQPARNGNETLTFTLSGDAGKTATVIYDSNAQYDSQRSSVGSTSVLNGSGQFADTFGANGHNYQVKIYTVQ